MKDFIDRPQADKKKISSKNQFEMCYLRHRYLRKVDYNPTPEDMVPYERIVKYIARKTYSIYKNLFILVGFDVEDIISIARVHLVSFLGLFAIDKMSQKYEEFVATFKAKNGKRPNKSDLLSKNRAILTMFLKQRMEDVVRICRQKAKNIRGMPVEKFNVFYGKKRPPKIHRLLLEDHEQFGYKKLDLATFRSIKKKVKPENDKPFKFAGNWYVSVPLEHKKLDIVDFSGAGLSPYDNIHNMNPEQLLFHKQEETHIDDKMLEFKNSSEDKKALIVKDFIDKNENNLHYKEEIILAKQFLKDLLD